MADETMVSVPVFDMAGKAAGEYEFDGVELAPSINKQLLHDVVVMYEANRRQGTVKTKTRGEVAGNKKKMFRQKGTGNARMGTKRSPVRRGGGHTFAKRPVDWGYRLPKKAVRLATRMALLSKFQDTEGRGVEAVVLDGFSIDTPKTQVVANLLKGIGVADQTALLVIPEYDLNIWKSSRNIANLQVMVASDLNAYALLHQRRLLITREAIDQLRRPVREAVEA